MGYIEHELAQQLLTGEPPPAPQGGRISRQLKHFPIAPEAAIDLDGKGQFLLSVVAGDRPGLLARIAHVLARHHIELHSAKINTLGARAEDSFWISGKSLEQPQAVESLREELLKQLA
jgi:[protein-PII] uridylyltransferase